MEALKNGGSRYKELDVMRAIGIILVVIGHSFPDASLEQGIQIPWCNLIYRLIYSFHMPLFFVASGFFARYMSSAGDKINSIKKRFGRLIVPYFVWGAIYIPFRIILNSFSSANFELKSVVNILWGDNPYSAMWFLYDLFLMSVVQILFVDTKKKLRISLVISLAASVISYYCGFAEAILWTFKYSVYFFLGMYFREIYTGLYDFFSRKLTVVWMGAGFAVLFVIVSLGNPWVNAIASIALALLGIGIAFYFSILFKDSKFLNYIGSLCMEIYILSGPILVALRILLYRIVGVPYIAYVGLAIALSIALSVLGAVILKKISLFSRLLFGVR